MLSLNDREWKDFRVKDIFTKIVPTKGKTTGQLIDGDDVPYIAASQVNNGYAKMCSIEKHRDWVSEGNCILFIQLGDGAAGYAHYEPMDFIGMSGKTSCGYIDGKLNRYNGVFIATCLSVNKELFSHAHSWTGERLLNSHLQLPVTNAGEPDYDFMTQYIKEQEAQKLQQYIAYAENELKKIKSDVEVESMRLTWQDFLVDDIFNIVSGKDAVLVNNEGDIPYVNSSGVNNGITCFVKNCPVKVKNCITIARTGTVGSTFYQENEVGISGNIRALSLKNRELNKEIAQFLITALKNSIEGNFDYGKILGTERIKNLKIKLPVTADGNIDYKYMEAYIYIYIYAKLKKYLDYIKGVA